MNGSEQTKTKKRKRNKNNFENCYQSPPRKHSNVLYFTDCWPCLTGISTLKDFTGPAHHKSQASASSQWWIFLMSNACNYTTLLLSELGWEVPEWPLFLMHAQKKADRQSLTLTIIIIVGAIINQMLSSQFLKFPPTSQNLHRKRSSMLGHYFPASLQHPSFYTISWHFRKQSYWKIL